jgi:putative transposase
MLDQNWLGFFALLKAYRAEPSKFRKKPGLPRYLDKTDGRYVLVYTVQALSKRALKRGVIVPSGLAIEVRTRQRCIAQVRIVPRGQYYVVEVVYEKQIEPAAVDVALIAGIDVGLNNLAAIASNKPGFVPVLVNGRPAKYINQGYNKRRAELQAKLGQPGRTKRMERLTTRRTRKINHYLHTHSRRIIDLLVAEGIGTLGRICKQWRRACCNGPYEL